MYNSNKAPKVTNTQVLEFTKRPNRELHPIGYVSEN